MECFETGEPGSIFVSISPLIVIMKEQSERFNTLGISAEFVGESQADPTVKVRVLRGDLQLLSRHMVVYHAAQENRARTNGVSIFTRTIKSQFSRIRSSVMPNPYGTKFTMELVSTQGRPHLNSDFCKVCEKNFFYKNLLIYILRTA